MTTNAYGRVLYILSDELKDVKATDLALGWTRFDQQATKQVEKLIAARPMDNIMAGVLSEGIDDIERMERMIASAEERRDAVLREVDRHRAALGQDLRRTAQEAQDAEFKVIEAQPAKEQSAA